MAEKAADWAQRPVVQDWAARHLREQHEGHSPTGAFCRLLSDEGYDVPNTTALAYCICNRPEDLEPTALAPLLEEVETDLLKQVEHFAEDFAGLSTPQRVSRWHELFTTAQGFTKARHRLEQLKDLLSVDWPNGSDDILVRKLHQLALLAPHKQRVEIRALAAELAQDRTEAIKRLALLEKQPEPVTRIIEHVQRLLAPTDRQRRKILANNRTVELARRRDLLNHSTPNYPPARERTKVPWYVIAPVIILLLRACPMILDIADTSPSYTGPENLPNVTITDEQRKALDKLKDPNASEAEHQKALRLLMKRVLKDNNVDAKNEEEDDPADQTEADQTEADQTEADPAKAPEIPRLELPAEP